MKKIFFLLLSMLFLTGCFESLALVGPATGVSNGRIVQSSLKEVVSYGIKKTTGKSPLEHVLAYTKEINPERKKEPCVSFIEKTNSEACAIAKKQVALTKAKIKNKTKNILKKMPLIKNGELAKKATETMISTRGQAFAEARKEGKDYFIFKGKVYNTKFKIDAAKKTIKSKNLTFVQKKKENIVKNKKSIMELAFDVQTALNKRN